MINDASKMGIAIDLIEQKVAGKMIERRNCNGGNIDRIQQELDVLLQVKNEIYSGNEIFMNKIIKLKEVEEND